MELLRNGRKRVVVTGLGAITPLGQVKSFWDGLKAGRSGIRRIQNFDASHLDVQIAGEADFDPKDYINFKEARRMARCSQMAQAAAQLAVADAGFTVEELEAQSDRAGVVIGTGLGGNEVLNESTMRYKTSEYRMKPSPFALINGLPNMPAHYVSRETCAKGPLVAITTACATGTQAIGDGSELIRNDRADIIFAGGVEAMLTDYGIAGFEAMKVLATGYNDEPEKASRPFDITRNGFVFSEGAAVFVLESLEHALKRGARILVEVLGHASSSDAYHIAALDPEGQGGQRAMRWALDDARIPLDQIGYINAHGTGTRANDKIETFAIKAVFGAQAYNLSVNSTKSMIGHCLGGAGAVEAVGCVMSLVDQVIHPTINLENPDPDCDLDYVPNEARDAKFNAVLSNNFGLGGQNACVVLGAM
ncbi:beta-ketoacyl-ACP synthase II [Chloroflexota bacterium]